MLCIMFLHIKTRKTRFAWSKPINEDVRTANSIEDNPFLIRLIFPKIDILAEVQKYWRSKLDVEI